MVLLYLWVVVFLCFCGVIFCMLGVLKVVWIIRLYFIKVLGGGGDFVWCVLMSSGDWMEEFENYDFSCEL